jgi:hypothetical protein
MPGLLPKSKNEWIELHASRQSNPSIHPINLPLTLKNHHQSPPIETDQSKLVHNIPTTSIDNHTYHPSAATSALPQ